MQKRFLSLERELEEVLIKHVVDVGDSFSPLMRQMPTQRLFEGDASSTVRDDGERDETEIRKFSTELQIPTETILYGTLEDLVKIFTPLGEQLVAEKERLVFETVESVTEKTGNIVNAEGKPLSIEKVLELFEKMQIDFDDNGRPMMPTMVAGLEFIDQFERVMRGPEALAHQKQFDEMMQRKKAEWLAREADRTLVG